MVDKAHVSFMRSLCMGQIEEDVIFPFPKLKDAEKDTLRNVFQALDQLLKPREKDFAAWDVKGEMPASFVDELKQFGAFSFVVPEAHGGMGLSASAYSRAMQEIASYDASLAVTIGAHSSIGMKGLLLFGTEEQKKRFLPKLSTGEMIAAFCLTEPGAGSDAASIKSRAVREGDDWVLNGDKLWITNGGIAQFFTVFAKTGGEGERGAMTAFIVTRDMPGVSVGPHENKMGIRASSTTTVAFDNVRVPNANVLGEVGKGFKVAMKILNSGRTGLGGGSVGMMKRLIQLATRQAKERHQFNRPIAEFGLVKMKLGQMMIDCYASEAVVSVVGSLIDQDYEDYQVEAAISKVYASECLWRSVDEALQIAGGNGYMREFPYERLMRDCRINRIFEGTNEILRLFIGLTAMSDVGTQLKELADSLKGVFNDPIKGFGVLSEYARKHASLRTPLGRTKGTITKVSPELKGPAVIFEESTRQLATAVDRILRKHGKNIIGKQFATRRLSEIMTDMFVLACVISRVDSSIKENGLAKAAKEKEILDSFAWQANRRIRANFAMIDDNDDELIKSVADHALESERFPWDTM